MGRYSLILVASLFLLLSYFVIGMINSGTTAIYRNIETFEYNNARNVANSASQLIINNIINHRTNWNFSLSSYPNGTITNHPMQNYADWTELDGSYRIKQIVKSDKNLNVTVSGRSNNREYDMIIHFRKMTVKMNMFDYAAYSKTDFTIGNQGYLDSFNSDDETFSLNSNAVVGYGSNGNFTNNGTLMGQAIREDRTLTPVSDPGGGDPLFIPNSNTTIIEGQYRVSDDINIGGNTTIIIDGDVTLYVEGNIKTRGNSLLRILEGSSLVIYLHGYLDTQGNGIVNDTNVASNLVIYGTETATMTIDIQGSNNASFTGAIYAPESAIIIRGGNNFTFYGAIVGREIEIYRNLIYDESLSEFGADMSVVTVERYSVLIWE